MQYDETKPFKANAKPIAYEPVEVGDTLRAVVLSLSEPGAAIHTDRNDLTHLSPSSARVVLSLAREALARRQEDEAEDRAASDAMHAEMWLENSITGAVRARREETKAVDYDLRHIRQEMLKLAHGDTNLAQRYVDFIVDGTAGA